MKKQLTLIVVLLLIINYSYSADYYWAANSGNNWNTTANWTDVGGIPIGTTPGNTDIVHFTNSNNGNCTVDVNVDIGGLIVDGYTGIIDINGYSFQVTSGDATFNTGTINGGTLTINTIGIVRFAGTTFGAIVNSISARVFLNGSIFNAVTTIEKNGASNDDSNGGNTFVANTTITNSGSARILLGNTNSDDFQADLTFINSGTSYSRLANNSAGNTIGGDLTVTNSGNGDTYIQINYNAASTLSISGNCTINNTGTGTQSRVYFDRDGTVSISGDLTINNNSAATTARMYIADRTTSQLTVTGTTTVINDGTTTNSQIYVGYNGDITFNGIVTATNNSSADNSRIYFNYDDNSTNTYNENIVAESTDASSDGISFGESNGVATLAANKTVTIGAGGYIAGVLRFRNFTQTGNTAQSLTCSGTTRIICQDSDWGGDISFISPRILTSGTTYNGTAYIEKTGDGDDASVGNNIFKENTTLKNSGSRHFYMGNGNPDDFQADLLMENTGSHIMYLAYNSAGNTIAGNLTINNSANGASSYVAVCGYAVSTLDITGNTTLNNTGAGTTAQIYLCSRGNINIGGDLNVTNNTTSTTGQILLANNDDASITITGNTVITNNGSATTNRIYIGNQGDIVFNGTLDITNNSSATNSEVWCNYGVNSTNTYNENIIVESTHANCDGIRFGQNGGFGTLAATKTITIGGAGFIAGDLEFRNFTQTGNTAHTLTATGTARIYNYDSNWGGDIIFTAPRINTRGTTYNRTTFLEKTGATDDNSVGGNTFVGNTTLKNSGSRYFMMGNGNPDDFQADLLVENTGTYNMFIAYNSAGNAVAGNLTVNNTVTDNGFINFNEYAVSTLTIGGTTIINNDPTADNAYIDFANDGATTCNGNVTVTNNGNGYLKRIFLGNNGDVVFNGTLDITNNSSASYSEVFCNYNDNSNNTYNENITVESTHASCDGIRFGQNGGFGTLAATKTITIGGAGFIAGDLEFRNFTQTGNTAHTLTATGTARIYNYDSNWGGDIIFTAPRINTRGTTYNRTTFLEKTGATDDNSLGGNTFVGNTTLKNSGSRYFLMGNGNPDDFQANLEMYNTGSYNMYLAYNSAGNTIAGNLTVSSTTSGGNTYMYFSSNAASTLSITGATTITNTSSADNGIVYFPDNGTLTCGGNVNITNNCSGITGTIYFGDNGAVTCNSDVSITNNCSGTNATVYVGNVSDVNISGNLDITNSSSSTSSYVYIASNENSTVQIDGNTTISNSGAVTTKRVYLGNQGDIIFNGTLALSNSSSATNSQIYCNYNGNSSNTYNENITVECTNAGCDGILFGYSNGAGTLAATKTITISGGGFIAGDLQFRNFTQIGNTAHTLTATGTARIYNYDSNWGGDVRFIAPRNVTLGTIYNRTAYLEKTGDGNDVSPGGNTFKMDVDFVNSGTGYFMLGNGTFDDYQANVSLLNSGTSTMYFARNGAGHSIAGNLNVTNSASGTNTYIYIGDNDLVTLDIAGTTTLLNNGSSDNCRIYFGNRGDITCNSDVTVTNNVSGTAAYLYVGNVSNITINGNLDITNTLSNTISNVYVANSASSTVQISGATTVTNSGAGTTSQTFLGNQGDVIFNGTLALSNSSSATNSQIYCNYNDNSSNTYNENIIVESTDASCDGILFGNSNGVGILAATKTVTIGGGGFIAGYLQFRNFTQTGATAQNLNPTNTAYFYNYDSNWGGDVNFTAPRMYTRGTTYNGTAFLEKTGAIDDASPGGNTFVGDATLKNSGTRYFLMGNGSPDVFQSNLLLENTSSHYLYLAYNSAGNTVAGDLTINNAGTTGSCTTNIVRYSVSTLDVAGNCTINNTSSSTTSNIDFGYSGDINISGNFDVTNNLTADNANISLARNTDSQIIINGTTTVSNNGAGTTKRIYVGNNGDIIFNGTLSLTNNSSATNSQLYVNHEDNGLNAYNENITVECTDANCDGILFGNSNGAGILADSKTITIGGSGFIAGYLYFRNFTQTGNTAQTLHPIGTTYLYNYNSEWNGDINFVAPRQYIRGTTFNSTAYIEKNGSTDDNSYGGNIYNDIATLVNSSSNRLRLGRYMSNDYNADVTYEKTGSGGLNPTIQSASTYAANININSNADITFGAWSNGRVIFDGTAAQSINNLGAAHTFVFRDIQTNNPNEEITLNTPIEISVELDLDAGNIITNSTNLLYMRDNSIVSSVSNDAYIDGPIEKIGNDAFTFPVGNDSFYAAISMSAPSATNRRFRAQYFHQDADNAGDRTQLAPTLNHISYEEYWTLDRTGAASSVDVTLSWDDVRSGGVDNLTTLRIAHWDGSTWGDEGNGSTTGNTTAGTIVSSAAISSFSPFTLASTRVENPLPVTLLSFTGEKLDKSSLLKWETKVETNNDYYQLEKSNDGVNYSYLSQINGAGNSNTELEYSYIDENPYNGDNYYRLKQVDFDGAFKYYNPVVINFNSSVLANDIKLYPNPILNNHNLTISYNGFNQNSTITIVDIKGSTININYTITEGKIVISTINLDKGIYFAIFSANDEQVKKMFVVE